MKIIIDGMGGDNAPAEIVKGTVEALSVIDGEIVLVGDEKVLTEELRKYSGKYPEERVSIRHASEVIFNEEAPVKAIRTKKDSSMVVGISMVKKGEGDLFISAGRKAAAPCSRWATCICASRRTGRLLRRSCSPTPPPS